MSGNPRDLGKPDEKLPSERPRSIAGSSPPTDDLDSEWDASPPPPAPEKRPSVRPTAVVVRTHPPPAPVPDGTPAVTTLLGVAPPPIVARLPKNDPLPRVEAPEPPAPESPAPVIAESSSAVEPAPAASASPPSPPATETEAPVASAAPQPAAEPEPETPPASEKPAPVAKPAAARAPDVPAPDSVSAGSTERPIAAAEDFPPVRRPGRALWIAATAALVAGGLWLGLRPADAPAPAPEPAAQPQPMAANPSPAQPAPSPAEPASPSPAAAPPPETSAAPAPAEPAGATAADGKKVVIVKVRPVTARFFHKGKKVGASPLRVELAPGEKRAFEVGHPDFVTRKVVIDGSEPEVTVGLYPKGGYARKAPEGEGAAP